ncbi:MAG: aKG-HExxH-type peptide beta-hydroxylase [Silvanigrellaceae bacterium]
MLGLYSYPEICQSLLNLADPETLAAHGYTNLGLRMAIQARAQQFEPELPIWNTDSAVLIASSQRELEMRRLFSGHSELNDLGQATAIDSSFSTEERTFKLQQLRTALDLIKSLDPNLSEIFHVVVSCIFTSSSLMAGGGTSSATPGVIWANLRPHWSSWDVVEFLVHELTHNILFFDEFSELHYLDHAKLSDPTTFAQSAILKRARPLDKVFHSIMVGIAVLNLRANSVLQCHNNGSSLAMTTGIHPDSLTLIAQIRASIASVDENRHAQRLLSGRGLDLLNRARRRIEEFANVGVALAI